MELTEYEAKFIIEGRLGNSVFSSGGKLKAEFIGNRRFRLLFITGVIGAIIALIGAILFIVSTDNPVIYTSIEGQTLVIHDGPPRLDGANLIKLHKPWTTDAEDFFLSSYGVISVFFMVAGFIIFIIAAHNSCDIGYVDRCKKALEHWKYTGELPPVKGGDASQRGVVT